MKTWEVKKKMNYFELLRFKGGLMCFFFFRISQCCFNSDA